jgi:hypothetical protein
MARSTLADGRRGRHERSCSSTKFQSFIILLLQTVSKFFHAVPKTAGGGVGRYIEKRADLVESELVPDFQHDHFPLLNREPFKALHGSRFRARFCAFPLEPALRFDFAREAPNPATFVVQDAIAKAAHAIMRWIVGWLLHLDQRQERFLQHILRLRMAQSEGTAVEQQLRGFFLKQTMAPILIAHNCITP